MVEAEKTKTLFTGSQFEDASLGHNRPANHTASTDSAAAPPSRFARFLSPFGHPRALPAVVVLTVLITLPTLLIGFFADDYYFLAQIEHNVPASAHRSPLDLYRFASHSSEIETWFADPGRKMDFFRPLTSLLFTLDHSLWGHFAAGYHVTSILLYTALVLCVGLLLRVALGVRQSGSAAATPALAALLFAVEPVHVDSAGWVSARHFMVAAIPAALGLAAHVRFVREKWRPGAWLGPLGVIAALLGSETGLGAVACWLSFDALGPAPPQRSSPRSRLLASMPVLAIAAAYAGMYSFFGFGAAGGFYVNPVSDPLAFLKVAAERVPTLIGRSLTEVIASPSTAVSVAIGFAVALFFFALYRLVRPAVSYEERVTLRWLLPGAVLSLVIASAGAPGARPLVFPSIGTAFLLAVVIYRGGQQLGSGGRQLALRQLALRMGRWPVVAVHLVLAPLAFTLTIVALADLARQGREVIFKADLDHSARSHVMVLAAPDAVTAFYPPLVGQVLAPQAVSVWQILSMANGDHRFTRTGAASFRLDVLGGAKTYNPVEEMFRSPRTPVRVGDSVKLTDATVTVLTVEGLEATSLDVTVDVPLDNPTLALLMWRNGRFVRLVPPPVGASVQIPWSH